MQRGYNVFYREAHVLIDDINQARELGELRKYRATIKAADLVVIDDLFLRKLPPHAGDELADRHHEPLRKIIDADHVES